MLNNLILDQYFNTISNYFIENYNFVYFHVNYNYIQVIKLFMLSFYIFPQSFTNCSFNILIKLSYIIE